MKRRDEGYILIYVLVVVVVLCAIVTGVCTVALRNLQTQERSIQRTRALYEAEGAIEKLAAELQSLEIKSTAYENSDTAAYTAGLSAFRDKAYKQAAAKTEEHVWSVEPEAGDVSGSDTNFSMTLKAENGTVSISTIITVFPHIKTTAHEYTGDNPEDSYRTYSYKISGAAVTYTSYQIIDQAEASDET